MVKREDMFLKNYTGVLMCNKEPLLYFKIENQRLVDFKKLRQDMKYFPGEFYLMGISYASINLFFRDRVVLDGSQFIREFLDGIGLKEYDFEKIVKHFHGGNNLDNWWVDEEVDKYLKEV